ncbi:OmpA family protein [Yeosuana sp. AK3]
MKTKNNSQKGLHLLQSFFKPTFMIIMFGGLIMAGISTTIQAQEINTTQYTRPAWHFGVAVGGNYNFYRGTTQELNASLTVPSAFRHGDGFGLYLAPSIEYYKPDTMFGFILQAGFDDRSGDFDQIVTDCNCPADLTADVSYISIEPSIRFAPFKSDFYMYAGPRFAFNRTSSFEYQLGINPAFPDQAPSDPVKGDFSNTEKNIISMQVGLGYDIQLSSQNNKTQFVLSPFASFQPYMGQYPRSIESWNITTLRFGATLKFGRGHELIEKEELSTADLNPIVTPEVQFTVYSPENLPVERSVSETFPLRNYVFFNLGSTEIPDRYVLLTKDQVKDFKEDQLEVFVPKNLSGRSDREMVVYYNILNILGDRMNTYPNSKIKLVGSSKVSANDGRLLAMSVKNYLVDIFGINESRISVEGTTKSEIPSLQPGGTKELTLLREEDRRVSIGSNSKELIMEFESGQDVPLKPVQIKTVQTAPIDSYVTFKADGADEAFKSWKLEITDKNNRVQYFGPFTEESVSIPGKSILGTNPEGTYKVKMIGVTKNGETVTKQSNVHMVLWVPAVNEQGMRFSIIYEFDNSEAINIYKKYLTEVVTPKIPEGGKVIIHGHTDVIGDAKNNERLSMARANDVKEIIEKALLKANRTDVNFELHGFGENEDLAPFENKLPEERFYNRTVIIDIIPAK